jgi:hypothetical protein
MAVPRREADARGRKPAGARDQATNFLPTAASGMLIIAQAKSQRSIEKETEGQKAVTGASLPCRGHLVARREAGLER